MKLSSLVCCCLVVSIPLTAWPQSRPMQQTEAQGSGKKLVEEERSNKARSEVQKRGTGKNATVIVTLRDKRPVKGYISQIDANSFQVTDLKSGQVTTIGYQDVDRVRKPGLSTRAKIAIGAAVAGGIIVAIILGSLAASGE